MHRTPSRDLSRVTPIQYTSHICQVSITSRAGVEKTTAESSSIEDAYVAEARLGADEFVEEPGRVGEVGGTRLLRGC